MRWHLILSRIAGYTYWQLRDEGTSILLGLSREKGLRYDFGVQSANFGLLI